jgi:hypothetical protein
MQPCVITPNIEGKGKRGNRRGRGIFFYVNSVYFLNSSRYKKDICGIVYEFRGLSQTAIGIEDMYSKEELNVGSCKKVYAMLKKKFICNIVPWLSQIFF